MPAENRTVERSKIVSVKTKIRILVRKDQYNNVCRNIWGYRTVNESGFE